MSNVIGSGQPPYPFPARVKAAHPLFDAPLESPTAAGTMPTSALPPELRQLSLGRADTPHAAQLLTTSAKCIMSGLATSLPLPPGIDLYVAMSALQKAIRIGNIPLALASSRWLIEKGFAAANFKRLRTIAVEDIGLGDPDVAAFVVWLAGRKHLRTEIGDFSMSTCAINFTSRAIKSRDMSDLSYWATLARSVDHVMPLFSQARSSELVMIASNPGETLRIRHAAARALFPCRHLAAPTWKRRRPEDRMPLYEALAMTPAAIAMIEGDVAFGGDVLTSAGPMVWAMMRSSSSISKGKDPFRQPHPEMFGDVLAASYDRHTRTGRRIIATMLKDHAPWAEFFARHPLADPMECMLRAIFYVEGGVLQPRLSHDYSDRLYWDILEAKLASTGIESMADGGTEMLALARDAIPILNEHRRKAISHD